MYSFVEPLCDTSKPSFHWNNFNEYRLIPRGLLVQEKLSHVCSYWRDIALSIPTLWHKLTFSVYTKDPEEPLTEENTGVIQRMGIWLERTKEAPLHITIFSERVPLLELWKCLLPEAHRIQTLRIYDQNTSKVGQLLSTLPTMPILECLDLGSDTQSERGQRNQAGSLATFLARGAPHLRELYVEKLSLPWTHVPWANITRLVIMARYTTLQLSYKKLSMVLEAVAPRLRYFAYQNHTKLAETVNLSSVGKALEFPHLNTLEVNVSDIKVLIQWLSRYCFPVLRRCYLDIETTTGHEFSDLTKAVILGLDKPKPRTNTSGKQQQQQTSGQSTASSETKSRPRFTLQRCRELTMGPCGKAQYEIGRFISLCFPLLQRFYSHPEGYGFPLEEVLGAFQTSCPNLLEVSGHHADFVDVHRMINARRLSDEMTTLTKVSLETVSSWTRSEVDRVREKVELVIEDGQEPKQEPKPTVNAGFSWTTIYGGGGGSGSSSGALRERDTDEEDSEEERRRRRRRLGDASWTHGNFPQATRNVFGVFGNVQNTQTASSQQQQQQRTRSAQNSDAVTEMSWSSEDNF
ncbi:hypothetical protein FRC15_010757 [Serendipita sp. 397]|nr:hypothetical protein FRC15_010757 [Serendipita sp. 397]